MNSSFGPSEFRLDKLPNKTHDEHSKREPDTTREILLELCAVAGSLFDRGYSFGSTGNISVRTADRIWITPTGQPLKGLDPSRLACLDLDGKSVLEVQPSKEFPFHVAAYRSRPEVRAVVHLHAPHSVALSCLEELDAEQPLPPITPYYLMRVAPLKVLPYFRPGSPHLAGAVGEGCRDHDCLLLRNHGLICLGSDLREAVDRAEELEETARLRFILQRERLRRLGPEEVEELERFFPRKLP